MPVSATASISSWPWRRGVAATRSTAPPASVNFSALASRFSRMWRRHAGSLCTRAGTSASTTVASPSPLAVACGRTMARVFAISTARSKSRAATLALPDSILAWSRMSLIRASSARPEVLMVPAMSSWSRSSRPSRSISDRPITAFSGVRSSWLMVARKRLLAWLAASAARLASVSRRISPAPYAGRPSSPNASPTVSGMLSSQNGCRHAATTNVRAL